MEIESASSLPPLSHVLSTALALVAVTVLMRRNRLEFSLAMMALILTLSRLPNLDGVSGLAKLVSGVAIALVGVSAWRRPGAKRAIPLHGYAYALIALMSIAFVSGAQDHLLAMSVQAQWFVMACSATAVAQCAVDAPTLRLILRGLTTGLSIGSVIALSSLVFDPGGSYVTGVGRFTPYGCNPNQIAVAFALSGALGVYHFYTARTPLVRAAFSIAILVGCTGSVLCVSRMSLGTLALCSAPTLVAMSRRPASSVAIAVLVVGGLTYVVKRSESHDLSHFQAAASASRWVYTEAVLEEIRERPCFGLLLANDAVAREEGLNAHNGYIELAYLCGLTLAVPNAVLELFATACVVLIGLRAVRSRFDPLLALTGIALFAASIVNGFVNNIIYYPTYTWAFLHLFLGVLWIAEAQEGASRMATRRNADPSRRPGRVVVPRHRPARQTLAN